MIKSSNFSKIKICLLVLTSIVLLTFILFIMPTKRTLADVVDTDLMSITKLIDEQIERNPNLAFSSNPYDYIKNNEYYNNIVNMGIDALPILEEKLQNSNTNGLEDYIMAIAIEEITNCNLKNDSNTTWASAKEFDAKWESFVQAAPDEIDTVLNSSYSTETKKKELEKYGKLAIPYINNYLKETNTIDLKDNKSIEQYLDQLSTSDKDLDKIDKYFKNKIK